MASTPKLGGLQDAFAGFTQRVEAAAGKMHQKMADVAAYTEGAVEKFGAAVDQVHAQARQIEDAANQMTNGGPPVGEPAELPRG